MERGVGVRTFVRRWRSRGSAGRHQWRRCWCRGGGETQEIPAAFGSPPALAGDGWRRRGGGEGTGGELSRRWLRSTSRSARVSGMSVGFVAAARSTSCLVTPRPPPLFYMRSAAGGPPAIDGLGAPPIRAREGKARLGSVGLRDGVEIKLTISPLISLYTFLFLFHLLFHASS